MLKSINCSCQSNKCSNQSSAQINQSDSIVVQVQVAAASAWLADLLRERKDAGRYWAPYFNSVLCFVPVTYMGKMT
jgi:hypothetical protein